MLLQLFFLNLLLLLLAALISNKFAPALLESSTTRRCRCVDQVSIRKENFGECISKLLVVYFVGEMKVKVSWLLDGFTSHFGHPCDGLPSPESPCTPCLCSWSSLFYKNVELCCNAVTERSNGTLCKYLESSKQVPTAVAWSCGFKRQWERNHFSWKKTI